LRHVPQHIGDNPAIGRTACRHRISEDAASLERLVELIAAMGLTVRDVLRQKGAPYEELGLGDPSLSDDQLLDRMIEHLILTNRPIVVTEKGARLCRPSELVLDILPNPDIGPFTKEDGEIISR
jgi:arsenate reductase